MLSRCVPIPMSSIFITIFRLRFVSLNRCGPDHAREHCWTGKVMELCYDRFGDFEGFAMRTETGEERRFHAHERNIEELVYRAWVERFVITVCVGVHDRHDVVSVVLRRAPRWLGD
jgi:hypothetical protein